MAYCSSCGKALADGKTFCGVCGVSAAQIMPPTAEAQAAPNQALPIVVRKEKWGIWPALQGAALTFVLLFVAVGATKPNQPSQLVAAGAAFAVGAAYIIARLIRWKKDREVVRGAAAGWTVAVMLLLLIVPFTTGAGKGEITAGSSTQSDKSSVNSGSSTHSDSKPAKTLSLKEQKQILLQNVLLSFEWRTDSLGMVMIADFILKNPTQYRFKDFEIKCTHSSPSGTIIDSNTNTVYDIVEPMSTRAFKKINMGFMRSQVSSSSCKITDLVPVALSRWIAP